MPLFIGARGKGFSRKSISKILHRSLPRGASKAPRGSGAPVRSPHVVVPDRYAAEWMSRAIALGRSRRHYGGRSSPLREFGGGIKLEARPVLRVRKESDGARRRVVRRFDDWHAGARR